MRLGDQLDWKEADIDESTWIVKKLPEVAKDPTPGFRWFRCSFFLEANQKERIAIFFGKIRDSDEAYFNGQPIGKTGSFPPEYKPDYHKDRIYSVPESLLVEGKNQIALRVYKISSPYAIKDTIRIQKEKEIFANEWNKELVAISFGYIFILVGFLFLVSSISKERRKEHLFFALFASFLGFYTLLRTQYKYVLFDNFVTAFNVELFVLMPLPAFFINFVIQYLDQTRNKVVLALEIFLGVLSIVLVIFNPRIWNFIVNAFNAILPVALGLVFYYVYKSSRAKGEKVKYILIAVLILLPTVFIDSLTALEIWHLPGTVYIGFFGFIMVLSLELSRDMLKGQEDFQEKEREIANMEKKKAGFLFHVSNRFHNLLERTKNLLVISKKEVPTKKAAKKTKSAKQSPKKQEKVANTGVDAEKFIASIYNSLEVLDDVALSQNLEENKQFEKETVKIEKMLNAVLHQLEEKYGKIKLNKHVTPDLEWYTSPLLIHRAIYHILENAILYSESKSPILLQIQREKTQLLIQIKDYGRGVSLQNKDWLGAKFFRPEGEEKTGLGIGIYLVKQIVKNLKGNVSITSFPNEGMDITIRLETIG